MELGNQVMPKYLCHQIQKRERASGSHCARFLRVCERAEAQLIDFLLVKH